MATNSHIKQTWMLAKPKATRESVAMRYGLSNLSSYNSGDRQHIILTFPQLKTLSVLYQSFIEAMSAGQSSMEARTVEFKNLNTTKLLIRRLMSMNLVAHVQKHEFSITDYGADEYEFQWYVADNVRHSGPNKGLPEIEYDESENNQSENTAKLTDDQVRNIRSSDDTLEELSKLYDVSVGTIWRVRNYKTYKDIT